MAHLKSGAVEAELQARQDAAAPVLEVVPARRQQIYSAQNGLLALNLLLFEICHFAPVTAPTPPQIMPASPYIVRRSGGPAALLTLCVLYAILARRIGIPLQIVTLQPPSTAASATSSAASSAAATHSASAAASAPSHQYLLRLPPQVEQEELYIDVLAQGRLRGAPDVAELATAPHTPAPTAATAAPTRCQRPRA